MISSIAVRNYKCLSNLSFRAGKLTLFTGANSTGKSSLLQCVLLARIAALQSEQKTRVVPLNGVYGLALGEVADVVSHVASPSAVGPKLGIGIQLRVERRFFNLNLSATDESSRYLVARYPGRPPKILSDTTFGAFAYLGADREGPSDAQPMQSLPKHQLTLGTHGEHVADVLTNCERDPVIGSLQHPSAPKQRLLKQVEAWLGTFIPGIEIRTEAASRLGFSALRYKRGDISSDWVRPPNTGFGVSYCVPIVVAALTAHPNSILIVDSPEAHLHPSAQSAMGSFLSRVAAAGIQVFVETHSDHILNGVRLAAIDDKHPLKRRDVVINHLIAREGKPNLHQILIDSRGALSSRPREFFDQAEQDLSAIVRQRFSAKVSKKSK